MAMSRNVLALNLYLRVNDEGFVSKCGDNIGEMLIPQLSENECLKMITKLGKSTGKKTNIITVEVRSICKKIGNSTNKSHKKSPKSMVRHGTNNHEN